MQSIYLIKPLLSQMAFVPVIYLYVKLPSFVLTTVHPATLHSALLFSNAVCRLL